MSQTPIVGCPRRAHSEPVRSTLFFDEPKPQGFWPAKNCVAFFRIFLSSLRMWFSRRSRSISLLRLRSFFETTSVSWCAVIHLFNVDTPTPRSSATCLRVSPLVSAIRTASLRNSSVRFSPAAHLLCCNKCYQRSGIKLQQVQTWPSYIWYSGSLIPRNFATLNSPFL